MDETLAPDFGELYRMALNGGAPVEDEEGALELVIELRNSKRTEAREG